MIRASISSLLLIAYASSWAQTQEAMDKVKSAMDAAYLQAKANQAANASGGEKNGLSPQQLRLQQTADPAAVAARFKANLPKPDLNSEELMIFVSTSMPAKALQMLGAQAKMAGAVLVFRGLRLPLGSPGAMEDMAQAVAPVAKTGAELQINPEAFSKYHVTAVPTFVIAAKEEDCGTDQCKSKAFALSGDVTLEYALETWSGKGGLVGAKADYYLEKIASGRAAK